MPKGLADLAELPVTVLKGVGPERAKALEKIDIETVLDLVTHYPRRYIDKTKQSTIRDLRVDESSWVFGAQRATVDRDGSLDWITLGFGSANGKVFQETQLAGPGAHGGVTGAYAARGRQHLDFDTLQEHAAPDTTSDLAFRGILADRSSAVWRGMIKVDPGAQRTDASAPSSSTTSSRQCSEVPACSRTVVNAIGATTRVLRGT